MRFSYFNPRPLAGATIRVVDGPLFYLISIHAPLRGRRQTSTPGAGLRNFNPRPLAGATCYMKNKFQRHPHFNPRPLAGATNPPTADDKQAFISIHAPLRGRLEVQSSTEAGFNFNPRPLAGATKNTHGFGFIQVQFQSTPPCGGDKNRRHRLPSLPISIHAPLRGRLVTNLYEDRVGEFQSTPPCGGDRPSPLYNEPSKISIHAPLRGRPWQNARRKLKKTFQSTPPCGGDSPCWT